MLRPFIIPLSLFLLFLSPNLSFPKALDSANLRYLSNEISECGSVPLSKDNSGFYATVYLDSDNNLKSYTSTRTYEVPVILSLYTSKTLLVESCLGFEYYDCDFYSCIPYKTKTHTIDFPYFTERGYSAFANVYLDYNYWKLNNLAAIAVDCNSSGVYPLGSKKYGIIGLGIEDEARHNFLKPAIFSITINKEASEGYLLFRKDLSKAVTSTPNAVLKANGKWEVNVHRIQIKDKLIDVDLNLIFDLNADCIGLPFEIFQRVLSFLSKEKSFTCTSDYYRPNCTYNGPIKHLPDLFVHASNISIKIPPQLYVKDAGNDEENKNWIILNLRGLNHLFPNQAYTTPSYDNFIILGYPFMSHYYSVFEQVSSEEYSITLYEANYSEKNSSWILALIGPLTVVIMFILCWIGCHCLSKHNDSRQAQEIDDKNSNSNSLVILSPLLSPKNHRRSGVQPHLSRFAAYKLDGGNAKEVESEGESNFRIRMEIEKD